MVFRSVVLLCRILVQKDVARFQTLLLCSCNCSISLASGGLYIRMVYENRMLVMTSTLQHLCTLSSPIGSLHICKSNGQTENKHNTKINQLIHWNSIFLCFLQSSNSARNYKTFSTQLACISYNNKCVGNRRFRIANLLSVELW